LHENTGPGLALGAAQNAYSQNQAAIANLAHVQELQRQQDQAKAAYDRAVAELDQNNQSLQTFKSNIDALNDRLNAMNSPAAATATAAERADQVQKTLTDLAQHGGIAATAEADQATAMAIVNAMKSGKGVTGDQANFLLGFVNSFGAQAGTLQQAAQWMQQHLSTGDEVLSLVTGLIAAESNHARMTQQAVERLSNFEGQLASLSGQIKALSTTQ
jgi:hypothetical protein